VYYLYVIMPHRISDVRLSGSIDFNCGVGANHMALDAAAATQAAGAAGRCNHNHIAIIAVPQLNEIKANA
jgi:hypothetical protein